VWNQEESKGINSLLETYKQEIKEIEDETRDLGPKFDKMIKAIHEVIIKYKKIKQTVKEWEERQQMVEGKGSQLEGHRTNNILIFGLEERKDVGYFHTLGAVMKFLRVNEAGGVERKH
jgi:chromosome segregation ATPase